MEEPDDLAELRRLLFAAIPYPTEEENLAMLAQTLSSSTPGPCPPPDPGGPGSPPAQGARDLPVLVPGARRSPERTNRTAGGGA
ncbi:hypothetical protein GCM10010517_21220 [Streptosporangium fragile]|uniref:Uncharacterized protein n=2 Tax=Streptosporangium fragile TaxID=46186 RepID=A0ABN3VTV3_9ACTN